MQNIRAMRDEGGVAGEGKLAGGTKLYSYGRYTMELKTINSDLMSHCLVY